MRVLRTGVEADSAGGAALPLERTVLRRAGGGGGGGFLRVEVTVVVLPVVVCRVVVW
jgi:hypothetical protein